MLLAHRNHMRRAGRRRYMNHEIPKTRIIVRWDRVYLDSGRL
jgi:hypothetical protein